MYLCISIEHRDTEQVEYITNFIVSVEILEFPMIHPTAFMERHAVYSVEKNNSRMCYIDRFVNTIVSVYIGSDCMLGSLQSICCVFIVIWWSSVFQNWHLITYPLSLNLKSWAELCLLSFLIVVLWKTWEEGHTVL